MCVSCVWVADWGLKPLRYGHTRPSAGRLVAGLWPSNPATTLYTVWPAALAKGDSVRPVAKNKSGNKHVSGPRMLGRLGQCSWLRVRYAARPMRYAIGRRCQFGTSVITLKSTSSSRVPSGPERRPVRAVRSRTMPDNCYVGCLATGSICEADRATQPRGILVSLDRYRREPLYFGAVDDVSGLSDLTIYP